MRLLVHSLRFFVGGLMVVGFVLSASRVVAQAKPQPIITASIKCLSLGRDIHDLELLDGQGKRIPLHIGGRYISPAHAYSGFANVSVVRALPKNSPAPTAGDPSAYPPPPEVVATVSLPAKGGDFLFLVSESTDRGVVIRPMSFSTESVPPGTCLIWNVASRPLGLSVGTQRALLNPGQSQAFHPVMMAKDHFDLRVFDSVNGTVRPLVGGPHFMSEDSRQLIFITERIPGQAPVRVKVVEELSEPPPRSPAAPAR